MKTKVLLLLVLALAPSFVVAQQSTDTNKSHIDALIKEMHDAATWGSPSANGIQLGAAILNGAGTKQFRVFTYLYDETNFWMGLYPPSGHRLSLSLKDATGKEVGKTKEGEAIGKPVGLPEKAEMKRRAGQIQGGFDLVAQKNLERYETPFNILDCFDVRSPGTHTLTVGATLYKKSNDGDIYEIVLPSVSIRVSIGQADIDNYKTVKNHKK